MCLLTVADLLRGWDRTNVVLKLLDPLHVTTDEFGVGTSKVSLDGGRRSLSLGIILTSAGFGTGLLSCLSPKYGQVHGGGSSRFGWFPSFAPVTFMEHVDSAVADVSW